MPLRPIGGIIDLPIVTAQDVRSVYEFGVSLGERSLGPSRYERCRRDLADYLDYIGAIFPEHFRSLQEAIVMLPDAQLQNFGICTFATWLYLLRDAPDGCVDHLTRRLSEAPARPDMLLGTLRDMLAGIHSSAALHALAEHAKRSGQTDELADKGFWIPPDRGPAVPRFTPERRAARFQPFDGTDDELDVCEHPVGLPVAIVMSDPFQQVVTWHYCSFSLAAIAGLPHLSVARLHLVSPPLIDNWTLYCDLAPDGRYEHPTLSPGTGVDSEKTEDIRRLAIARQDSGRGQLVLLPFDEHLVYSNGHVMLTPGVVGTVGGPPIGLYPNPSCPACGKLMFHVATLANGGRRYGEGFRSLFVCEVCERAACHATSWN